jgi:hypothetical protein
MSTSYISAALRRSVFARAAGCCEYCLLPEIAAFLSHEVDHVIAEKHEGKTESENLALACSLCNKHKGSDVASVDPTTGEIVRLYHPRRDRWADHFVLNDGEIVGQTPIGRVTVRLLQMNQLERMEERRILVKAGVLRVPLE